MKILSMITIFFLSVTIIAGTTISISAGGTEYQHDECYLTNWAWEPSGTPIGEIWDILLDEERVREVKNWRIKAGD